MSADAGVANKAPANRPTTAEAQEVAPGYKRTDVGLIPEDWDTIKLIDLCRNIVDFRGRTPKKLGMEWGGGEIPALSARNVKLGYIDFQEECYLGSEDLYKRWMTNGDTAKDDIVLTTEAPLGNVALIPDRKKYILSQRTVLLQPNPALVSGPFLFQFILSDYFQRLLAENSTGSTAKGIQRKTLETLPTLCPPIKEQRAIAAALSDVDGLLGALEALIAKKRAIKQAAMQQLLTGKTRLPGFSGEWETKKIRDIAKIPVTDGPHLTPKFLSQGIPFLSVNNLVNNRVDTTDLRYVSLDDHREFSKKCKPQMGDVLLGKAASVGKVAIVDFIWEFNIWSPIALIRINRPNVPHFVYYALQGPAAVKQINYFTNSSSQGNVGMGDIEKLELPLPPSDEQQAITTVLSDMDAEIVALEHRRDKTRAIKQGMMQQLLTGRVRLVCFNNLNTALSGDVPC